MLVAVALLSVVGVPFLGQRNTNGASTSHPLHRKSSKGWSLKGVAGIKALDERL